MGPDPSNPDQAIMPWRGRITLSKAPGHEESPDQTSLAAAEVETFFGAAGVTDFDVENETVNYHGESKWSYRRFILHYAHLCKIAGGVEAFCIGSEMRGLSQIRGPNHTFPAVAKLVELAADVRSILGPDVKISYGADWSEYFGYHIDDNVYFHLDPLWACSNIDFVGIDNYMPISDWRDGRGHADEKWGSLYNLDYLASNIAGGEGFDWFYSSDEGVDAQNRIPIRDTAYGEDWVFKYKDLLSWWSNSHHDRINGVRQDASSPWIPTSKPIRFTEYGCAAIDKGTNQPNNFLDQMSSESSLPRASLGNRDDFIQMQYYRAMHRFWNNADNNPFSDLYFGRMLDLDHLYAWAWDSRPYPDFPRSVDVWSDGESYYRGHWLNGRATSVPLDRLAHEVCGDAGVTGIETESLFGLVHGYGANRNQSPRAKLQPLFVTFSFDCSERWGMLCFESRGASGSCVIKKSDTVIQDNNISGLELTHASTAEMVSKLRFSYVAADCDFRAAVAEATTPDSKCPIIVETEYDVVLPEDVAKQTAEIWLAEILLSCDQMRVDLPLSFLTDISDCLVEFSGDSFRIDRAELGNKISIHAVRIDPTVYKRNDHEVDRKSWKPYLATSPIDYVWLDLPLIDETFSPSAPFIALMSTPWRGPAVLWSSGEDADYSFNSSFENPAFVGRTLVSMDRCEASIFDRGPPLTVELPLTSLESSSLVGLLSGKNLMAIGGESPEQWEIFQFMIAELISPNTYNLSHRLRGRFGSDAFMPSKWPAGSKVVLINSSLKQINLQDEQVNLEQHYRIGFASEGLNSETVRYDIQSFSGSGLRPLSVVHLTWSKISFDGHFFKWVRRTRLGGDAWNGLDVPVNESQERYTFVVKSVMGEMLTSLTLHDPEFIFTSAHRTAVGANSEYRVEVSQLSAIYGPGPSRSCLVS